MRWAVILKKTTVIKICVCFIFLLFLGELFARFILGLGTPPLIISHPTIEYIFKPNQDVKRFGNRILINEYGMRSENFQKEKTNNEFRVMIFGDSVVNGGSLTDHEDLITTILQKKLQNYFDKKVIVGNVSAGSWGPGNWLAYAKEYGFFDADLVVLVISSHDYMDNPTFEKLNENTHPTETPISALSEGLQRYLPRLIASSNDKSKERDSFSESEDELALKKGCSDLSSFLELAKKNSSNIIVCQHFERQEIEKNVFEDGYLTGLKICKKFNIKVIGGDSILQKSLLDKNTPFQDNIHLNKVGNFLYSNLLYKEIIKMNFK